MFENLPVSQEVQVISPSALHVPLRHLSHAGAPVAGQQVELDRQTDPDEWQAHDDNGRTFYYNQATGETSWTTKSRGNC